MTAKPSPYAAKFAERIKQMREFPDKDKNGKPCRIERIWIKIGSGAQDLLDKGYGRDCSIPFRFDAYGNEERCYVRITYPDITGEKPRFIFIRAGEKETEGYSRHPENDIIENNDCESQYCYIRNPIKGWIPTETPGHYVKHTPDETRHFIAGEKQPERTIPDGRFVNDKIEVCPETGGYVIKTKATFTADELLESSHLFAQLAETLKGDQPPKIKRVVIDNWDDLKYAVNNGNVDYRTQKEIEWEKLRERFDKSDVTIGLDLARQSSKPMKPRHRVTVHTSEGPQLFQDFATREEAEAHMKAIGEAPKPTVWATMEDI